MNEFFEEYLKQVLAKLPSSPIKKAMNYSLLAGGKRIRPLFFLAVLNGYGIDPVQGIKVACAIEMIHTYSLIHDDLPCMDNDDYRRGSLTCHKQFDEATALLAGDALLTEAFHLACHAHSNAQINCDVVEQLALASGAEGMILGQNKDLMAEDSEDTNLEQLILIHRLKTGKLISLALVCGCLFANKKHDLILWQQIGEKIGLAFQIQDDILDATKTTEQLGKSAGSDLENKKTTYVSLLGLAGARAEMNKAYLQASQLIHQLEIDETDVVALLNKLIQRQY